MSLRPLPTYHRVRTTETPFSARHPMPTLTLQTPGRRRHQALQHSQKCRVSIFRISYSPFLTRCAASTRFILANIHQNAILCRCHLPLAKLLINLVTFVFGYDESKTLESAYNIFYSYGCHSQCHRTYEHVPYVAMRMVPATLGVLTIFLSYRTSAQQHPSSTPSSSLPERPHNSISTHPPDSPYAFSHAPCASSRSSSYSTCSCSKCLSRCPQITISLSSPIAGFHAATCLPIR